MDRDRAALVQRRLLSVLWLALALLVCVLSMRVLDAPLSQAMRALPPEIHDGFKAITNAGLGKWYIWPTLVGALGLAIHGQGVTDPERARRVRGLAWALAFVGLAVLLSGLATDLIKLVVGRGRPKVLEQLSLMVFAPVGWQADYQSFPSGHATTSAALALVVAWLVPRLWFPALVFAVTIAVSRVVINAHFLGDVMGGAAIGCFVAWWLREWFADRGLLFTHRRDGSVRWVGLKGDQRQ